MNTTTVFRRISVFLDSQVNATTENREALARVFSAAHIAPLVQGGFIAPNPILGCPPIPDGSPWMMLEHFGLLIDSTFVHFLPSQIDVVCQKMNNSEDVEDALVESMKNLLLRVCDALNIQTFPRLAFSPVVAIDDDEDFSAVEFLQRHVTLPQLRGTNTNSIDIGCNYPVTMSLGEQEEALNCILHFNLTHKMNRNTVVGDSLMTSIDINTFQNNSYDAAILNSFLEQAIAIKQTIVKDLVTQ